MFHPLKILSYQYNYLWTSLLPDMVPFSRGFGSKAYFYNNISGIMLVYWAFIMFSSSIVMKALVIIYLGFMKRVATIRMYPVDCRINSTFIKSLFHPWKTVLSDACAIFFVLKFHSLG